MPDITWRWSGQGKPDEEDSLKTQYEVAVQQDLQSGYERTFKVGDAVSTLNEDGSKWFAHLISLTDHDAQMPGTRGSPNRMRCTLRWLYGPDDIDLGIHKTELLFSDHIDGEAMNPIYVISGRVWLFPSYELAREFRNKPDPGFQEETDHVRIITHFLDTSKIDLRPTRRLRPGELEVLLRNPSEEKKYHRRIKIPARAIAKNPSNVVRAKPKQSPSESSPEAALQNVVEPETSSPAERRVRRRRRRAVKETTQKNGRRRDAQEASNYIENFVTLDEDTEDEDKGDKDWVQNSADERNDDDDADDSFRWSDSDGSSGESPAPEQMSRRAERALRRQLLTDSDRDDRMLPGTDGESSFAGDSSPVAPKSKTRRIRRIHESDDEEVDTDSDSALGERNRARQDDMDVQSRGESGGDESGGDVVLVQPQVDPPSRSRSRSRRSRKVVEKRREERLEPVRRTRQPRRTPFLRGTQPLTVVVKEGQPQQSSGSAHHQPRAKQGSSASIDEELQGNPALRSCFLAVVEEFSALSAPAQEAVYDSLPDMVTRSVSLLRNKRNRPLSEAEVSKLAKALVRDVRLK